MMLHKLLFGVFSSLVFVGASMDGKGNPLCRLYVNESLGGIWAECYSAGCPNPCTENLIAIPGNPLALYCPCGPWDDEVRRLNCLPKYVFTSDPPVFGGGKPDCESLCDGGCELLKEIPWWGYAPACSECP